MSSDNTPALKPQQMDQWFLDLLVCPGCEQRHPVALNESKDALLCACGRYSFPVREGIPILLVEEAVTLDPNADPASLPTSTQTGAATKNTNEAGT